ncbi:hypothetical protein DFJ69_3370 [Thermomonospora umbrina]|uniref:Uncharacterized protein n=1 Tax=Thermomonospora umbrina TaxID=111806 RepID=A0A3D9SV25_9ACTN|nr:hypothetical protein DFJ69_3370 [Thermomonospora umbrina]
MRPCSRAIPGAHSQNRCVPAWRLARRQNELTRERLDHSFDCCRRPAQREHWHKLSGGLHNSSGVCRNARSSPARRTRSGCRRYIHGDECARVPAFPVALRPLGRLRAAGNWDSLPAAPCTVCFARWPDQTSGSHRTLDNPSLCRTVCRGHSTSSATTARSQRRQPRGCPVRSGLGNRRGARGLHANGWPGRGGSRRCGLRAPCRALPRLPVPGAVAGSGDDGGDVGVLVHVDSAHILPSRGLHERTTDEVIAAVESVFGPGKVVDRLYFKLKDSTKPADVRKRESLPHLAEVAEGCELEVRRGTADPAAAIAGRR